MGEIHVPESTPPTQVRQPGRATFRTFLQGFVGAAVAFALILPEILNIVLESTGGVIPDEWRAKLVAASLVVGAIAAALARVMASPAVERWLEDHASWLAAKPR